MADFSLTTLFVSPVGNTLPSSGSTQDLTAGQVGFFTNTYAATTTAATLAAGPYFYIAQGRTNTYLQGSKRSDKIAASKVTEFYKVTGSPVAANQVTSIGGWNVTPGTDVTITLRAFSSYINTLYFNGFTRSVTVSAPCLACGGDPCGAVDVPTLIDKFILKFTQAAPGTNPDNINFNTFFQFQRIGNDANATLVISGKPLTKYGVPCDIAAFPYEYDRMWFRTFVYPGPATTSDFIVADNCNIIATPTITQRATYVAGTSDEIAQLEKNFYSYQAGYLKHLYRMVGYNQNFEYWVSAGTTYDTIYIKFNSYDNEYVWGDYIVQDSTVIIACPQAQTSAILAVMATALGTPADDSAPITSTTSTTTTIWPATSTTTTLVP